MKKEFKAVVELVKILLEKSELEFEESSNQVYSKIFKTKNIEIGIYQKECDIVAIDPAIYDCDNVEITHLFMEERSFGGIGTRGALFLKNIDALNDDQKKVLKLVGVINGMILQGDGKLILFTESKSQEIIDSQRNHLELLQSSYFDLK